MVCKTLAFFLCVAVVVVVARPQGEEEYDDDDGSYEFQYQIQEASDELDFGHKERRSDGRVEGYYYVLLPDGRTQKVRYYVDEDSGFVAEVDFSGEAQFEDSLDSDF